jgi:hypothetical protein
VGAARDAAYTCSAGLGSTEQELLDDVTAIKCGQSKVRSRFLDGDISQHVFHTLLLFTSGEGLRITSSWALDCLDQRDFR